MRIHQHRPHIALASGRIDSPVAQHLAHLSLGASLYVPASRDDLAEIASGQKYPQLRSIILCTEDSVADDQIDECLENLRVLLRELRPTATMRFIRVRDPHVLRRLLQMPGIEAMDGFVFPKVTGRNCQSFFETLGRNDRHRCMLTLESPEVFEPDEMRSLRRQILQKGWRDRVLSLRIGGNDLLHCLGMRRPRGMTLYQTPLALVISQLVTIFRPHGFNLTAPVFDFFDQPDLLAEECRLDLAYGLFGKSSVHPEQISIIERQYRVPKDDYEMALRLRRSEAPAVFRSGDAMCEVKTHSRWAEMTVARANMYGLC